MGLAAVPVDTSPRAVTRGIVGRSTKTARLLLSYPLPFPSPSAEETLINLWTGRGRVRRIGPEPVGGRPVSPTPTRREALAATALTGARLVAVIPTHPPRPWIRRACGERDADHLHVSPKTQSGFASVHWRGAGKFGLEPPVEGEGTQGDRTCAGQLGARRVGRSSTHEQEVLNGHSGTGTVQGRSALAGESWTATDDQRP